MARPLPYELDQIMLGETPKRQPGWQVLIYDVRSTSDTIRDIVTGQALDPLTGPFDITAFVRQVKVEENGGTYGNEGVVADQISVAVIDPTGDFDPLNTIDDPLSPGRFFRSGNVIRLLEGDTQVPTNQWPITFTGNTYGQAGYDRNRTSETSTVRIRALGREATFLTFQRTSEEFLFGTTYFEAAQSVAVNEMGLDVDEIDFPSFGAHLIAHKVVQLVQENPITMLARIMFVDSLLPKFTGEGKLSAVPDRATGPAVRIYSTNDAILRIERPASDVTPASSVCVVGLDSNLSIIDMPRQALATLDLTTGYFTPAERVEIYWRDDRSLMAKNVKLKTFVSLAGGLGALGGGESIDLIPSGDPEKIGIVGAYLEADTGFAPWIMLYFLGQYVQLSLVPDLTINNLATFGKTISIGRLAQAVSLGAALYVMSTIGRGSYAFVGDPFEYVYKEIRRCARIDGVGAFDVNELVLNNHMISDAVQADTTAFQQLFRQQAEKSPRLVSMLHDVGLQANDIFETQADGRRFLATQISRILERVPTGGGRATVQALEVTPGVTVGT